MNIYGDRGTIFADVNRGLYYQNIDSVILQSIEIEKNNPEAEEITDFYHMLNSRIDYSNAMQAISDVKEIEKVLNENK